LQAGANPKTERVLAGGWTATAAGAAAEFQGAKAVAFLTVMSGFGKTVSVLGIFNEEAYLAEVAAFVSSLELDKVVADGPRSGPENSPPPDPNAGAATMHAAALVREFEQNEVRATQAYAGKRVRIRGTVNSIEVVKDGRVRLTFKSSLGTYNNARCYFGKAQGARVAALNAHEEATVEGTVRGWEDGYGGAKVFLLLEDCVVP
jgi:hypothetical protein